GRPGGNAGGTVPVGCKRYDDVVRTGGRIDQAPELFTRVRVARPVLRTNECHRDAVVGDPGAALEIYAVGPDADGDSDHEVPVRAAGRVRECQARDVSCRGTAARGVEDGRCLRGFSVADAKSA